MVGRTYASIDAVSKPTKRLVASGGYDPALARQRIAEWKAKEAAAMAAGGPKAAGQGPNGNGAKAPLNPVGAAFPQQQPQAAAPKSAGASRTGQEALAATADFDPEVGF